MAAPITHSAGPCEFTLPIRRTGMARSLAASTSMLSTPMPVLTTSFKSRPASSTAALTRPSATQTASESAMPRSTSSSVAAKDVPTRTSKPRASSCSRARMRSAASVSAT
ncbi:MAG: hypothetical protein JWN32_9 [Solirubrobacterales bacterium]|nr:hypothetical protein [Solirubrobacterales bacterium]